MFLIVPVLRDELVPFSSYAMFAEKVTNYSLYKLKDEKGQYLDVECFQLRNIYTGMPTFFKYGILPAPTYNYIGQELGSDEIVRIISEHRDKCSSTKRISLTIKRYKPNHGGELVESVMERSIE